MPGTPSEKFFYDAGDAGSTVERGTTTLAASTSEMIDRVFREPYFRFLLFWAGIWRNWFWVLPCSLILGAAFAVATYLFTKDKYTSDVWLRIFLQQPYVVFSEQTSPGESMSRVSAALQIIYSPQVINGTWNQVKDGAQKEGVDISQILKKRDPAKWLMDNINIRQRGESSIHVISFTTDNPKLSYLIMQSVMDSYDEYVRKDDAYRHEKMIAYLKKIAKSTKIEIDRSNTKYNNIAKKIADEGVDLLAELNKMKIDSQATLSRQIIGINAEIEVLKLMVQWNKKILDGDIVGKNEDENKNENEDDEDENVNENETEPGLPDSVVEVDVYNHPMMIQLLAERVALLNQRKKLSSKFESPEAAADAPGMLTIQKNLDDLDNRIEQARNELMPDAKKRWLATVKQQAHLAIIEADHQIQQLESRKKTLEDANSSEQAHRVSAIQDINEAIDVLTQKNRDEEIYSALLKRISVLETESQAQRQVTQISQPSLPGFPDGSQRLRSAVLVFLVGLMIPVLLAWLRELSCPRFYHLSQFPMLFPGVARETVAGMSLAGREAEMNRHQKRAFYFSIDEICNNFSFGRKFARIRTYLFSSVRNDDGQTQLALSVAERLAQMKKNPVLLIDAHGNNPILRNLIGVESKASLADVLEMRLSLNEAIVRDSQQPNLYFLPDGPASGESSIDLYSDGKSEMLLKELRNHYNTIIISARPMERSSGAHVLCHFVDAVVVALRLYDTPRKNTEMLYERFVEIGKPITSFMISGIPERA